MRAATASEEMNPCTRHSPAGGRGEGALHGRGGEEEGRPPWRRHMLPSLVRAAACSGWGPDGGSLLLGLRSLPPSGSRLAAGSACLPPHASPPARATPVFPPRPSGLEHQGPSLRAARQAPELSGGQFLMALL